MSNLNETILSKCRDRVAVKNGYPNWGSLIDVDHPSDYMEEAALLAMEALAKFYRKLAKAGWIPYGDGFWDDQVGSITHEEQLYEEYGRVKG